MHDSKSRSVKDAPLAAGLSISYSSHSSALNGM
jgi:hypothetical protein